MKLLLIISLLFPFISQSKEISPALLTKANTEYQNGNYTNAIDIYKEILGRSSIKNLGKVHFNLGNAYFRNSNLGKSIFHYRIAVNFFPRSPEIKFNLQYSREKTTDKIEKNYSWSEMNLPLTKNEILSLILLFSTLFWIPLFVLHFKKNYYLAWLRNISLICTIFFLCTLFIDYNKHSRFGVVSNAEAVVYSSIGKDRIKLFSLHEGAEFNVYKILNNKWAQIRLSDNKKGWISLDQIIHN